MRKTQIIELKDEVTASEKHLNDFIETLGQFTDERKSGFNVSANIPDTDSNVSDLIARHASVAGLVEKLDPKGGNIVPASFFAAASTALRSTSNAVDKIESQIKLINGSGNLQSIDYNNFNAKTTNGRSISLSGQFKSLYDSSEAYLVAFHNLFQAINPSKASFNFSAATEALSATITHGAECQGELLVSLEKANKTIRKFELKEEEISNLYKRANKNNDLIDQYESNSSQKLDEITNKFEKSKEISEESKELKENVDSYKDKFDEFDSSIENRNNKFEEGARNFDELEAALINKSEYIETLIKQANEMVSGATVAGLSSEFKTIRDDLTVQLNSANNAFYWSIATLFASAIPLILFIFTPIVAPFMTDNQELIKSIAAAGSEKSGWQYIGQVLARFVILLPGIWLVSFSTRRYNSLFRLREHYSYKYSMAFAVDGFKKQSPEHEEMIAALVFEQLAFNPADKMGKQSVGPDAPPSPITDLLLGKLRAKKSETEDTEK